MLSDEISAAFEDAGVEPEAGGGLDKRTNRLVYSRRWGRLQAVVSDLDVEALEAEVLWGSEACEALAPLRACVTRLCSLPIHQYVRVNEREHWEVPSDRGYREGIERKVWAIGNDEDELTRETQKAVARIEEFLRPRLDL